jgi:hypothetical protein
MSRRSIRRVVSSLQAVRMFCVTETHAPTIADIDGRVNGEWENVRYCRNWEEMSVGSDFHGVRSCMSLGHLHHNSVPAVICMLG